MLEYVATKRGIEMITSHKAVFRITKVKAAKGGGVIIEGYANRAKDEKGQVIIDRGMEYVPPNEWIVEEWNQNPVVYFDHRMHLQVPIGKGLKAEIRPDGLWVRIQISDSSDPEISRIRDLILEGVIKTLSAGFDCREEEMNGITVCRDCVLREVSVVSIPMNQGSFFSVASKAYWLETPTNQIRVDLLKYKGAGVAAMVQEKIDVMTAENHFEPEAFLEECVKLSRYSDEEVQAALEGEVVAVPDGMLNAFSELLQLDAAELREANAEDIRTGATGKPVAKQKDAEPPLDNKAPDSEDEALEDQPANPESEHPAIPEDEPLAEDLPSPPADKPAKAKPKAEAQAKTDAEQQEEEPSDAHRKCFQEVVLAGVVKMIDEGKDQDEAVAACIKTWKKKMASEFKNEVVMMPETFAEIYKTVRDHAKAKMVPGDVDQGQAATSAQQQTNVLLGQLIMEIQTMSKKLDNLPMATMAIAEVSAMAEEALEDPATEALEEAADTPSDEQMAKYLDNVAKVKNNIQQKLKSHGLAL